MKIKEIREIKKLKQDDVVRLSGIKKRSYVDYENGKKDIPLSKLQNIANVLEVSIIDLIDTDSFNNRTTLISSERKTGTGKNLESPSIEAAIEQLVDKKINEALVQICKDIEVLQGYVGDTNDYRFSVKDELKKINNKITLIEKYKK